MHSLTEVPLLLQQTSQGRAGARAGAHQKARHQNTADDVHDGPARLNVRHQHSRRVCARRVGRHSQQLASLDLQGKGWHDCLQKRFLCGAKGLCIRKTSTVTWLR